MRTTAKQSEKRWNSAEQGWWAMVAALRAAYQAEVERLASALEERIRAGDFSGCGDDGPRYRRLEAELAEHPWCAAEQRGHLVVGCSTWPARMEAAAIDPQNGEGIDTDDELAAGDCLAHDVLAAAGGRGWIGPVGFLNSDDLYPLRRRAPAASQGARGVAGPGRAA